MPVQLGTPNSREEAAQMAADAQIRANQEAGGQDRNQAGQNDAPAVGAKRTISGQNQTFGADGNWKADETPAANAGDASTDNKKKIDQAVAAGYASLQELMTATGLTSDEITQELNNDYNLNYRYQSNNVTNQQQNAYDTYQTKIDQLNNGTFQLSTDEQSQIDQLKRNYANLRDQQLEANKNYEGAVTLANIRTGRQEFMMDEAIGNYQDAIDNGIQKIADLDQKAAAAVSTLKDAFRTKNYKLINDQYTALNKALDDKTKALKTMYDATKSAYDEAQKSVTTKLNQQKLMQTLSSSTAKSVAPTIYESMTGDAEADGALLKQIADYYGIDQNILSGEVNKYSLDAQKKEQALNKLTPRTYKGVTTWYNSQGQKVDPNTGEIVSGKNTPVAPGTPPAPPTLTPEEKKFDADLKAARKKLASGKPWGPEWDYLKAQYGTDDAVLDELLNKSKYYTN